MMSDELVPLLCWAAIPFFGAMIGGAVGSARGRTMFGLALGFLLGPIGWLLIFLLPKVEANRRVCPTCGAGVPDGAWRCKQCRTKLADT